LLACFIFSPLITKNYSEVIRWSNAQLLSKVVIFKFYAVNSLIPKNFNAF